MQGGLNTLDKKIINWIACTHQSFNQLNHYTTKQLLSNTTTPLLDESHYRKKVLPLAYELVKAKVQKELEEVSHISFTSDSWTNGMDAFLRFYFIIKLFWLIFGLV